ncbi:TPA: hypothetical protein DIS56_03030 [Candidatus Saccharibacteria bacterium]|nr:MAG: hypothetical protein A3F05_02555 [Candidatus Saccharibacteria bacterium RIFCSPHIGHO2_12_FULL_47_17]HCM52079.1 hypothetical protein [Candidatus Saccharibacteria bacterium]
MKFIKRRIKKVKKVREKVTDVVAEKAAGLNLSGKPDEPLTLENVPRITSESIAEHREEVLSGARKYIYPLQHSKHRVVVITSIISAVAIIAFAVYTSLALYKFYQHNTFLYRVTQVVPFPIAKAGSSFVEYENYLFELRRYIHYYQTQQQNKFGGQAQIDTYRKQALEKVVSNAYIKQLAKKHGLSVSDKEVDLRIAVVRDQNRLGANNKVFADVLRDYWGWSVADFKRDLKNQMLAQKVEARLDTEAQAKAKAAFDQLKAGADFAAVAKQFSEDAASREAGGDYGFAITRTNPNVPPEVIDQLYKMQIGGYSDIIVASRLDIDRPDTLEIVKLTSSDPSAINVQHISFNLKDISLYVEELKKQQPVRSYVHF